MANTGFLPKLLGPTESIDLCIPATAHPPAVRSDHFTFVETLREVQDFNVTCVSFDESYNDYEVVDALGGDVETILFTSLAELEEVIYWFQSDVGEEACREHGLDIRHHTSLYFYLQDEAYQKFVGHGPEAIWQFSLKMDSGIWRLGTDSWSGLQKNQKIFKDSLYGSSYVVVPAAEFRSGQILVRDLATTEINYPERFPEFQSGEADLVRNPGAVEQWEYKQTDHRNNHLPYDREEHDYAYIDLHKDGHNIWGMLRRMELLEQSLSCGELVWLARHREQIPASWHGQHVYGWNSVVQDKYKQLWVPYLDIPDAGDRRVINLSWNCLKGQWYVDFLVGLKTMV